MKKTKSFKGFSLIELLIAITIIAILTAVGIANYRTASQKARDSRRQSELEQIRAALELWRSDEGSYPSDAQFAVTCGTPLVGPAPAPQNTYIEDMPCDPKEDNLKYGYKRDVTGYKYELGAVFETSGNGNCSTLPTTTYTTAKGYCVKNP